MTPFLSFQAKPEFSLTQIVIHVRKFWLVGQQGEGAGVRERWEQRNALPSFTELLLSSWSSSTAHDLLRAIGNDMPDNQA